MTEVPEVPDQSNSGEELQAYISRLHHEIEWLQGELESSKKETLELKQELNQIEEQASDTSGGFASIMEPLQAMHERIEEFEEGYLDEDSDYGHPGKSDASCLVKRQK